MLRLITIPISHFCEKARWALDRAGLPYREDRHLQIFHYVPAALAGGGATVPVLALGSGRTLADSTDILRWVDEQSPGSLYPQDPTLRDEVLRLEDRFDERFGPATRRVVYFHLLDRRDLLHYNATGVPSVERVALNLVFPLAALYIRRRLRISQARVDRDVAAIRAAFDEIGARVDGRRYLVGDTFTAADLAFASLAAPMILPAEYGTPLPRPDEVPEALRRLVEEYRQHPAGVYAMRMFREERGRQAAR